MATSNKKDALGKGIRTLLENIDADLKNTSRSLSTEAVEKINTSLRVPIDQIEVNPQQPRRDFDEILLSELAASIKIHDIIQPLTVSRLSNGKYRIVAGERRYRAAKIAGLKDVPVYIRETKDSQLLELALLENLQRENLNSIEIAISYKRLIEELDYTQEQLAERMGKERSTVTNYIRLLKLPPDIQVAVRNGVISMGHARALVNVDAIDKQLFIFHEIKSKELSVRQTEELVRTLYKNGGNVKKEAVKSALPPAFKKIEDNLASHLSTKISLSHSKKGNGSILIEYFSIHDLNRILEQIGVTAN